MKHLNRKVTETVPKLRVDPFTPVMSKDITKLGNKFIFVCEVEATKLPGERTNFNISSYTFTTPEILNNVQDQSGVIGVRSYLYNMYERLLLQIAGKV